MADAEPVTRMVAHLRWQADACARLGSPMYRDLLARVADDVVVGGPARAVLVGHAADPGPSALGLRLMGSVHRLVLQRRAGGLAPFYPSVGGTWEPTAGWAAFAALLRDQPDAVREWLDRAPQTNEAGRAAALAGGLLRLGEHHRLPVRLFEIGSSAGLNLLADRFGYTGADGLRHGPADTPLVLERAWQGRPLEPWPELTIVERRGSDLAPVDASSTEGRLALTAYVWPDQADRLERLRGALRVAARHPVEVSRLDAASFVRGLRLADGAVTVLWHSVMWQYLSSEDKAEVTATVASLGAAADESRPFAHLFLEPVRRAPEAERDFLVVLEVWPGGERRVLGTAAPHGLPVTWE